MSRVRTHKVRRGGKTYTRKAHNRKRLQPRRAWVNAKRSGRALRRRRRLDAFIYGSAAAAEIGTWTFLKGGSAVLIGLGIGLAALGYAAKRRT